MEILVTTFFTPIPTPDPSFSPKGTLLLPPLLPLPIPLLTPPPPFIPATRWEYEEETAAAAAAAIFSLLMSERANRLFLLLLLFLLWLPSLLPWELSFKPEAPLFLCVLCELSTFDNRVGIVFVGSTASASLLMMGGGRGGSGFYKQVRVIKRVGNLFKKWYLFIR